ncbi:MAG: GNAT family N-acetyltransferase [Actinobacteria bacterium]|nr:GNAT family N-acetyltransferase [Actinomycetota bacterium]
MSGDIRVAALRSPPPAFRSGRAELDEWLKRHSQAATRSGSARVYLGEDGSGLVGYFALAAGSVDPARAGTRTRSGMPRHPIPVVLLARLVVSESAKDKGVGRELVRQAALLALRVSRLVAVRALVVDAVDEPTAGFYAHVGFTPNEANPLRLEILVKDLEALIGDQPEG